MIDAREALAEGRSARVRPRGHSMSGVIEDNQEVCIEPVDPSDVQAGDVVFLAWKQSYLLHIVYELDGEQVLIGNARGRMNGWTDRSAILGRVAGVRAELSPRAPRRSR